MYKDVVLLRVYCGRVYRRIVRRCWCRGISFSQQRRWIVLS